MTDIKEINQLCNKETWTLAAPAPITATGPTPTVDVLLPCLQECSLDYQEYWDCGDDNSCYCSTLLLQGPNCISCLDTLGDTIDGAAYSFDLASCRSEFSTILPSATATASLLQVTPTSSVQPSPSATTGASVNIILPSTTAMSSIGASTVNPQSSQSTYTGTRISTSTTATSGSLPQLPGTSSIPALTQSAPSTSEAQIDTGIHNQPSPSWWDVFDPGFNACK
jgi:hypothetical protein